jgi:hypothetical protein
VRSRAENVAVGLPPPLGWILYLAVKVSGVFAGRPVSTVVALARITLVLWTSNANPSAGTVCVGLPPVTATLIKATALALSLLAADVTITSALVAPPGRPCAYTTEGPADPTRSV